ncbi:ribonuclease-like protein P complex subunit Pop4 [Cucurbitaria berberidis CBS 394.84]|uniref:Ribonuclease P protein subunit n=1 Tax=Cucurbitaria berberidis CBS 394.84 TaxID=1168544 RepID=A0A9P4L8Y6_9PLEO|nr:ribonuclease-like protein P complex subunit Pop4 [Cucurbitaria berberidis CBS 394.84]KAF1846606.1 ribonuclease-like protein P complex subunit Pop4 [Cucurbitaria berberidis CBS 394.84]
MTDSKGTPFAQALLGRAFSPDTAATHYTERVIKRPLNIRATSPTPSARAVRRQTLHERKQEQQKRSKNKPRPLSAAQKRKLCLNEIPKEQQKYAIYEPLHSLWVGYMREILGLNDAERAVHVTPNASGQMLASADMHGALLSVVRSRCVSRVGLEGIVVRDTRFTFEIITRRNVVKAVPKEHTVFRFEIPLPAKEGEEVKKPLVFEIFGEQFQTRAADRANKKFRIHYQPDL